MNNEKGLYQKYIVTRTDGKPLSPGRRFVLSLDSSDPHQREACRKAISAYADSIFPHMPELSFDLWKWIDAESSDPEADYENRLVEHRAWLKKATAEADELRSGLFAANVRIEELRTVLLEVLPLIDGTLRKEVDFPIPAAMVRKVLEGVR